jgi:prepilin-type N-terminal cleavage/methylation domain-containing protein
MRIVKSNQTGFTLVELMVAVGLVGILGLAMGEVSILSAKNSQAAAVEAEFNNDIGLLLGVVNATTSSNGNSSGCSNAFTSMNVNLAAISQASQPIVNSAGSNEIDVYYKGTNLNPVMKVSPANGPYINYLNIQSITFTQIVDQGFITPTGSYIGSTIYMLNLEVQATQVAGTSNGAGAIGGLKTFKKDILIPLWIKGTAVMGCIS